MKWAKKQKERHFHIAAIFIDQLQKEEATEGSVSYIVFISLDNDLALKNSPGQVQYLFSEPHL